MSTSYILESAISKTLVLILSSQVGSMFSLFFTDFKSVYVILCVHVCCVYFLSP